MSNKAIELLDKWDEMTEPYMQVEPSIALEHADLMAQELRRLHAEVESLRSMKNDYMDAAGILHGAMAGDVSMLKPLANKSAKVMDEVDGLRKDAARYRWLRSQHEDGLADFGVSQYSFYGWDFIDDDAMDSTIDAAMQK